ncbi:3'(2'),5'-bisphosphate nucleotidase CysQ [Leptospira sp. 96542]|nr:3'(2'),5'-bisphosphate nucleotidase CysQ [Leptospira sp. 96542]
MERNDFIEVWRWVLEVGDKILDIYKSDFEFRDKGKNDPVTEADLLASEILNKKISERFPNHGFLSEEKKDTNDRLDKEWVWILDPIDGTREFVRKNDQFALSLGLVRNGEPIWGVIFNPATGEFFSKDSVNFVLKLNPPFFTEENLNLLQVTSRSVIHPIDENETSKTKPVLLVSYSEMKEGLYDEPYWKEEFELKAMGSIAYKLALLSCGYIDLIVSLKPKNEWDICAGIALLDTEHFERFPLKGGDYKFNQKNTISYGLVAGKRAAIDYLKSKTSVHRLSLLVKDSW